MAESTANSPPMRRCSLCSRDFPLRHFRRYYRGKKRLMPSCNKCSPAPRLRDMKPAARVSALKGSHPHVSPVYVERMNARQRAHFQRSIMPDRMYAVHARTRRAHWVEAIINPVRHELVWAKAARLRYVARQGEPVFDARVVFFNAYCNILSRILAEANAKSRMRGTPVKPTMEESNPRKYLTDTEYRDLLLKYSDCNPSNTNETRETNKPSKPRTRSARDPWVVSWRE